MPGQDLMTTGIISITPLRTRKVTRDPELQLFIANPCRASPGLTCAWAPQIPLCEDLRLLRRGLAISTDEEAGAQEC